MRADANIRAEQLARLGGHFKSERGPFPSIDWALRDEPLIRRGLFQPPSLWFVKELQARNPSQVQLSLLDLTFEPNVFCFHGVCGERLSIA